MNKTGSIHNRVLSTLVLKSMMEASKDQLKEFSVKERNRFKNEQSMRTFCSHATIDQLMTTWIKLGYDFMILFYANPNDIDHAVYSAIDQFDFPEKRVASIAALAKARIAVITSEEIVASLMVLEQDVKTNQYAITPIGRVMPKQIKETRGIKKTYDTIDDTLEAFDDFVKMNLETLCSQKEIVNHGLTELQMRMLMFLYLRKDTITDYEKISAGVKVQGAKKLLVASLKILMESRLVIADTPDGIEKMHKKNVSFMITGRGKKIVMEYVLYLHNQVFKL